MLLAVPNFSEGRDERVIDAIAHAFATGAALLDVHSDPVHNRSVATLSGPPRSLAAALVSGARACVDAIDMSMQDGAHPTIGALDVCPVVWLSENEHEAAREEALAAAQRIAAEAGVPVFLYGELASHQSHRERAFFRAGGLVELTRRMESGEVRPDFGPAEVHPTAGATLVTARPPLAAFNIELAGADLAAARDIASRLRESGGGLDGVRAIGIDLGDGRTQVSTNIHDPMSVSLATVAIRIRDLAKPHGARPVGAEIVGLVPERALEGWPDALPIAGFHPAKHVIESRVRF
jgi:glutamate formiminotransferase